VTTVAGVKAEVRKGHARLLSLRPLSVGRDSPPSSLIGGLRLTRPAIDFLTFRLDVLNEQAKRTSSLAYEEARGVTLRDLRVLRLAYAKPGVTQSEVVEAAYLEKTLVSKLVTSLVKRKLVRREIGEEDARWVRLYLTDEGRETVQHCNRMGRQMQKAWLAGLSAGEIEAFERTLAVLTERVHLVTADRKRKG
jgi:DNA-binding MarR family transcriptional regulator